MKPLISVLMLTYNQGEFVARALQSIIMQESVSYDLEVILIDDGSSDNTVSEIETVASQSPIPIQLIANKHEGVSAIAKNLLSLVNMAKGDFIAFLAGDDFYEPDRFFPHLELLAGDVDIVYSEGVNCHKGARGSLCHPEAARDVMASQDIDVVYRYLTTSSPVLFIQGILAKSDFLKSIQPFDVDLIADDWVFNLKVFRALINHGGSYRFDPNVRFVRNVHESNTSRNLPVHYERIRQVAERYCDNSLTIKARFIGEAMIKSAIAGDFEAVAFFARKAVVNPLSVMWIGNYVMQKLIKRILP